MSKKLMNFLRSLLVIIPTVFVLGSVLSNCSGDGACSGSVNLDTADECTAYAADNGCSDSSFDNGVCDVSNCAVCEQFPDDLDPVIDIDDF